MINPPNAMTAIIQNDTAIQVITTPNAMFAIK